MPQNITTSAGELVKAGAMGLSVDDCLGEAMVRGWKGFEAKWVQSQAVGQGSLKTPYRANEVQSRRSLIEDLTDTSWAE